MTLTHEPPAGFDYTKPAPWYEPYSGLAPQPGLQEARTLIEYSILNQPRSLQKRVGPSELGTPCQHCLAAKLAGWEKKETDIPWLPFVGTAVHAALEEFFIRYEANRNAVNTTGRRYLTEYPSMVGVVDGVEIGGSVDLVDLAAGMTIDWKIVGTTTLREAKSGPSDVYRAQAHLYAKGLNDAGFDIRHVAIAYLPRNAITLADAIWWTEPHDRALAERVLATANAMAVNLRAMESISTEARDAYISSLPRHNQEHVPGLKAGKECRDCQKYGDAPAPTARETDVFAGIPTR